MSTEGAPVTPSASDRALSVGQDSSDSARAEQTLLEWSVHLAQSRPSMIATVVAVSLVAGVAGVLLVRSILVGLIGGFLVLCAAAEFLLPIKYRLTTRRATCSYGLARLEIEWARVRRILRSDDCVRLSLFPDDSKLDRLRGLRLRAEDAEALDRIVEIAKERIREARRES